MSILTKWKKTRGTKSDFSSKVFSSSRAMARPNRRETIDGEKPLPIVDLVLWGILLGVSLYLLLFSPFLTVSRVEIAGLSKLGDQEVRRMITDELSGKYLGIWPKDNFFAVRSAKLSEQLASRYPLFRSVSVTRRFPDTLLVETKERERIVLWRGAGGQDLMLGEDGRLFRNDQALSEENAQYVVSITDLSSQPAAEGQLVADERLVPFVSAIGDEISRRLGLSIGSEYSVTSRFAGELRMMTGEGWELYASTEMPMASTIDALALLFEKELPAEKRAGLKYIDMRIENRVYYAFKDAPAEEPAIQASESSDKKVVDEEKKKKK
jgi:cell division septal protein FtsQ